VFAAGGGRRLAMEWKCGNEIMRAGTRAVAEDEGASLGAPKRVSTLNPVGMNFQVSSTFSLCMGSDFCCSCEQ
jgi:hypothetical protein